MRVLSGLQATPLSLALVKVILRGFALASVGTSQRSEVWSFSSYEGSVTEKTTHLPSGLTFGAPTRFINHMASCVIGCLVVWAVAAIAKRTRSKQARRRRPEQPYGIKYSPDY